MFTFLKNFVLFIFSVCSAIYAIFATIKLLAILSTPQHVPITKRWMYNLLDYNSSLAVAIEPLLKDLVCIEVFILQHSLMKTQFIKSIYQRLNLMAIERSVYCFATGFCVHFLVLNWEPTYSLKLWSFEVEQHSALWWLLCTLHALAWYTLFAGCWIMDLPELLGLKQVYYHINKLGAPSQYKSESLKRLYCHMRHPSFVALLIILWTTNILSLDRIMLAVMMTSYMYVAWRPDQQDYQYQCTQRNLKIRELQSCKLRF